jgi:hypothetical protein
VSASIKPAKGDGKIRQAQALPVVLTADEAQLLHHYRIMDLRRRSANLRMAKLDADRHPMIRRPAAAAPTGIRLIAVAGKRVPQ